MDKRFTRYLIGASVLVACASASADCANALTAYASANSPLTGNGSKSYILANHPECFGGGSTTSQVQINSTSFQQVAAISSALSARFMS